MKKILISFVVFILSVFSLMGNNVSEKFYYAKIYTTEGIITVKLYNNTPGHRDNFIRLAKGKTYDGLLFHRVIKNFMVQGGDPFSKNADSTVNLGDGSLGYQLPAEIVYPANYHKRGALAAARTSDDINPKRESSASQFYIVTGKQYTDEELDKIEKSIVANMHPAVDVTFNDEQRIVYSLFGGAPYLDGSYTVFGEVVRGFDVLDKIENAKTNNNDRPLKNISIIKIKIFKK